MIDAELVPVVAARFRALGEPGRLLILQALSAGERSVGQLAEQTGRSQPNVSQHLAHLSRAGLVEARRAGQHVFYRVADPYLEIICRAVCDSLAEKGRQDEARLAKLARRAPRPRPRAGAGDRP
jgi:ArsR family transcriptional regulator